MARWIDVSQVSSLLAREDENFSVWEIETNRDENGLEEPPEGGGNGPCAPDPCDPKQADQAYIETLESIKFEAAELVVRAVHDWYIWW